MIKFLDAISQAAMELFRTPNGQVRLIGAIMCIGPGYHIATSNGDASIFSYAVMGLGFILVMVSIIMAIVRAQHEGKKDG